MQILMALVMLLVVTVILFASVCYGGSENCTVGGGKNRVQSEAGTESDDGMTLDNVAPDGGSLDVAPPPSCLLYTSPSPRD